MADGSRSDSAGGRTGRAKPPSHILRPEVRNGEHGIRDGLVRRSLPFMVRPQGQGRLAAIGFGATGDVRRLCLQPLVG